MSPAGADVGHVEDRQDERHDPDRHVQEEDPPPVEVGDDESAQRRAEQHPEPGHDPDRGARVAALGLRQDRGDHRQALGSQQRGAEALHRPERDELTRRCDIPDAEAGDGEQRQTDQEQLPRAMDVAQAARGDQHDRVDHRIRRCHPQDRLEAGGQIGDHVRDRDVDDRDVQQGHEQTQTEHRQEQAGVDRSVPVDGHAVDRASPGPLRSTLDPAGRRGLVAR